MILYQGATLAVTLILLFLMTLLGITAMQVTHMQEKMSSNLQDKELSFIAAESALTSGENWVLGQSPQPAVQASCNPYPCVLNTYQNLNYTSQTASWWNTNSAVYGVSLDNVATPPRYFVEFLQFAPDSPEIGSSSGPKSKGVFYYQVTSRGTGSSDNSASILQTSVGRRY
jgi:type IV pilus assembly protein PilX